MKTTINDAKNIIDGIKCVTEVLEKVVSKFEINVLFRIIMLRSI